MIWRCELMISLCVAEELVFALCNGTHLLGSPCRRVAGSRLHFSLAGSRHLPGRNARNVPPFQSLLCCVQGACGAVFPCSVWKVLPAGVMAFTNERSHGKTT